jgi:predicted aspartyl protease
VNAGDHVVIGAVRTDIEIENPAFGGRRVTIAAITVDTQSPSTWLFAGDLESLGVEPVKVRRFQLTDGRVLERRVGSARIHAAGTSTFDDVVFAEAGDAIVLGARSLSGLNLRVDPMRKELVDAGPAPAAAA